MMKNVDNAVNGLSWRLNFWLLSISQKLGIFALIIIFGTGLVSELHAEGDVKRMSLTEIIALVLENNHEISVRNLDKVIETERINVAASTFDPSFEASYSHQFIDTPQNAQDVVATGGLVTAAPNSVGPTIFEQRNDVSRVALTKKLETGMTAEVGTRLRALENSLNRNQPPGLFSPEYESFTGLTLTQPLLRDAGREVNTTTLRIAKSNLRIADLEWRFRTAATVANAMKLYYDALFMYENMLIQQEAIELAQRLYEDNKKRSDEGVLPPNEVLVAEAAVYARKDDALLAETQYVERQNALQLLFKTGDEIGSETKIIPADRMKSSVEVPSRSELLEVAQNSRYDLLQAIEVVEREREKYRFAQNQIKPRFDLIASAGMHGLDGSVGGTYDAASRGQGPEWTVGFAFSVPLGANQARAEAEIAKIEEKQALIDADRVKTQISLEIDTILNRIKTDKQRLATGRKSKEVAFQTLDAEIKRLNQGVSTSFQVLQFQTQYSQTQSRELAALADLNKDQLDLWLITGQLLDKMGIAIDETPDLLATPIERK